MSKGGSAVALTRDQAAVAVLILVVLAVLVRPGSKGATAVAGLGHATAILVSTSIA